MKTDACQFCSERNDAMYIEMTRDSQGNLIHVIACARCHRVPPPSIVVLCGSTRFFDEFERLNLQETLAGNVVLSVGSHQRSDDEQNDGQGLTKDQKRGLDRLHMFKIEMAHEVLVVNPGGYIGESTSREIEYARKLGKPIRYSNQEGATSLSAFRVTPTDDFHPFRNLQSGKDASA